MDTAREHIVPCDMERPYAFISYSSLDAAVVMEDVQILQHRGYNIWVDVHLDKSKPSWREDVYSAIENLNCEVVVYYVSRNSLASAYCLEELQRTRSETAKARRLGKEIGLLAVEVETIGNMVAFSEQLQNELWQDPRVSSGEKGTRLETIFKIRTAFLNNNDRVRIHAKADHPSPESYYGEMERDLGKSQRSIRFSDQRVYRNAVEFILKQENRYGEMLLQKAAEQYVPAALMLAYLYGNKQSPLYRPGPEAKKLRDHANALEPAHLWRERAVENRNARFYTEALAYYLGYGETYNDGESLFRASQMWIGKGSRRYALACLGAARELGEQKAARFYGDIQRASDEAIKSQAFRDEACVN